MIRVNILYKNTRVWSYKINKTEVDGIYNFKNFIWKYINKCVLNY